MLRFLQRQGYTLADNGWQGDVNTGLQIRLPIAKNKDGSETLWSFEGSAPTALVQRGITGSTFEPGDTVTILYCPLKDGRPGGGLGWARLANGTFLNPADGGCTGSPEAVERWKGWLA